MKIRTDLSSRHVFLFLGLLFLVTTLLQSGCGKKASRPHMVSISWNASTSPVIGYNVYRAPAPGGPYTKLNSTPIATLNYEDTSVEAGHTYSYKVTAVDAKNVESGGAGDIITKVPGP